MTVLVDIPQDSAGSPLPSIRILTQLDGTYWSLLFRWNRRSLSWSCDLSTSQGVLVAGGLAVRADAAIHWPKHLGGPPGSLIALDQSGAGQDPGLSDFGSRVKLYYVPAAELP